MQVGEFNGKFSLAYYNVNSKGKRKERSKIIKEEWVIFFKKKEGSGKVIEVKGKDNNQYGIFNIIGTTTKSDLKNEPNCDRELRKSYKSASITPVDISVFFGNLDLQTR